MVPVSRPAGATRTTQVAIVALPPVSMSGVGPIVDALNLANEIDGRLLYRWQVCSWDGRPVPLAGGAQWHADAAFNDAIACDWLIVVSERFQQFADYRLFLASLARVGQRTPVVTGIHHGVWWLAMAGQLSGYRVSVNWETYQQFAEQFERSIVTQQIFEIDRDRATCAGGQATVDFMLAMIGREHGADLAERCRCARGRHAAQRRGAAADSVCYCSGERHPRLNDALLLMEANVEDPLTTDEIAGLVGVSRRQLERLFRQYLGAMPSSITSIFGCSRLGPSCSGLVSPSFRFLSPVGFLLLRTFLTLIAKGLGLRLGKIGGRGSRSRPAGAVSLGVGRSSSAGKIEVGF